MHILGHIVKTDKLLAFSGRIIRTSLKLLQPKNLASFFRLIAPYIMNTDHVKIVVLTKMDDFFKKN